MKKREYDKLIGVSVGLLAGMLLVMGMLLFYFGSLDSLRTAFKLGTVLRVMRTQFIGDYDAAAVEESLMDGAVAGLNDRWSYYLTPEENEAYIELSANRRYQGIGVTVEKDEGAGGFRVLSVTKDGHAMNAGIQEGDVLLAVDGSPLADTKIEELRGMLAADYGQSARITVRRTDGTEETLSVSCEPVYTSPVNALMLDGSIGYISLANFREGSANDAIAAVEDLLEQGAESLIFDVRNDPGGQTVELVGLLDYLLPEGDIFIRTDKRGNRQVETSQPSCVDVPMAVIVNGDSYSAAEYFAATLREYDWAVVVGEPTTGKARSQVTLRLHDGSGIHLSVYSYLTPQGHDLSEEGGITPDVEITLSEEERQKLNDGWLTPEEDPHIQSAIAALTS